MTDSKYYTWPSLEHLYLEDSFVLDIEETPSQFSIILEAVLTTGHPAYHPPKTNEQHCYARGEILFSDVKMVLWLTKKPIPITGPNSEIDFGNVDYFTKKNKVYQIGGEWGDAKIYAATVQFRLLTPPYHRKKPAFIGNAPIPGHRRIGKPSVRLPHYVHR